VQRSISACLARWSLRNPIRYFGQAAIAVAHFRFLSQSGSVSTRKGGEEPHEGEGRRVHTKTFRDDHGATPRRALSSGR
jgi:hypothetical protein